MVIHFGGAESVLYLWINGVALGLSKDTRLPCEFDVTDYVKIGATNVVCVVCVKWSDASYLEDQDQWWMGGLYRDVWVYSTEKVYIQDVFAVAGLEDNYRDGASKFTATIGFQSHRQKDWQFQIALYAPDGSAVWPEPLQQTVATRTRLCRQPVSGGFRGANPQRLRVESRESAALYVGGFAARARRTRGRTHGDARRFSARRNGRPRPAYQRPAGDDQGRQPPRVERDDRQNSVARRYGSRHRSFEAAQLQRGALRALSKRRVMV